MTEDDRYREAVAQKTAQYVIPNARRLLARKHKQDANWVLAMKLYGLGSTFAYRLCLDTGLPPDATS